jgi:very-short-patch-repair endonuclease
MLRNRRFGGFKFRRQCAIGNYIADFVCIERRLVIELDGAQHAESVDYDAARSAWLTENGYRVLRLWNSEFLGDIESARDTIWAALHHVEMDLCRSTE